VSTVGDSARPRVGLMATHPVQYYVPWYRQLARVLDLEVFYCHRQAAEEQARAGFGVAFEWDVPLLEGYRHRFLVNRAAAPDVSSFFGCHTPEIAAIIRDGAFDAFIVHGWASRSFWQAIIACWRSRTPVLVRGDSQLPSARPGRVRLAKRPLYRWFIPRFDAYLVVGQRAREYYVHYGADPRRMFFAPHAVDNDFFSRRAAVARAQRDQLRAEWGLPAGAVVFLFAGKLSQGKRPEDFARAIARASRHDPRVWGLIVGDGPLRPALSLEVTSGDWPVRFAGFLNQTAMPVAYAVSDALVMTSASASETWGLVVNEAMACGLPALVSDRVGCGPDLVLPGRTGEVFPCGAVGELASLVAALASDAPRLARLGAQARQLVQRYSPAEAVAGTVAAVQSVMSARARAPVLG
jgi:glycosyltransferase involved in cell wall biosynthesis